MSEVAARTARALRAPPTGSSSRSSASSGERLRRQPRRLRRAARDRRAQGGRWSRSSSRRRTTTGGTGTGRSPTRRATSPTRGCASSSSRVAALAVNQLWLLRLPRLARLGEDRLAGDRDRARDAAELPREQALVVPALRLVLVAVARARARPGRVRATTTPPQQTSTVTNPLTATSPLSTAKARSNEAQVIAIFLAYPKVADWLEALPAEADHRRDLQARRLDGATSWSGEAGEIATGTRRRRDRRRDRGVDRAAGRVADGARLLRARSAARRSTATPSGSRSARSSCSASSTGGGCSRCGTLDLLVLLSFSVSLWFFNHGHVFTAMPLAYPPLAWLLARCLWIARRDTPSRGTPVWPVWVLAAATVFLAGFRIGLNVRASNVIDVGYSGMIGADRIVHGQSPYGHFPVEDHAAEVRARRQRRRGARPDPDERPLRDREPARRHLRAGLLPRVHPGLRDLRLEPQVGRAARRCT